MMTDEQFTAEKVKYAGMATGQATNQDKVMIGCMLLIAAILYETLKVLRKDK